MYLCVVVIQSKNRRINKTDEPTHQKVGRGADGGWGGGQTAAAAEARGRRKRLIIPRASANPSHDGPLIKSSPVNWGGSRLRLPNPFSPSRRTRSSALAPFLPSPRAYPVCGGVVRRLTKRYSLYSFPHRNSCIDHCPLHLYTILVCTYCGLRAPPNAYQFPFASLHRGGVHFFFFFAFLNQRACTEGQNTSGDDMYVCVHKKQPTPRARQ